MDDEDTWLRLSSYGNPSSNYFNTLFGGEEKAYRIEQRRALMQDIAVYGFWRNMLKEREQFRARRFANNPVYCGPLMNILAGRDPYEPYIPTRSNDLAILDEIRLKMKQMTVMMPLVVDLSGMQDFSKPEYPPVQQRRKRNRRKKAIKKRF